MKKILTNTNNVEYGPFNTVESTSYGHLCDGAEYPTHVTGTVTVSEVADDYETPQKKAAYNEHQKELRAEAYKEETDSLFFQYQRGDITEQDWLDAVDAIKARYPYKS